MFHCIFIVIESNSTPPIFSNLETDFSTGYLQDALFEFSSKRRRLDFCKDDEIFKDLAHDSNYCYGSKFSLNNLYENYDYLSQIIMSKSESISGEPMSGTSEEETSILAEISSCETFDTSSSRKASVITQSLSHNEDTLPSIDPMLPSGIAGYHKRKKKPMMGKVVYPFAVVKPGGLEGDVTLEDINERILMPPTRPVKHPVGDFACRPIVSPDGPGLSGKAVVALTRIHTQGRGTITIIRTRG